MHQGEILNLDGKNCKRRTTTSGVQQRRQLQTSSMLFISCYYRKSVVFECVNNLLV